MSPNWVRQPAVKRANTAIEPALKVLAVTLIFGFSVLCGGCTGEASLGSPRNTSSPLTSSSTTSGSNPTNPTNPTSSSLNGQLPSTLGWYQIPNTSLASLCPPYSDIQGQSGCQAVVSAWGSALTDTNRNRVVIHGGGHTDYFGNEIYAIDFNANPIAAVLVKDSSHGTAFDSAVAACSEAMPDGTPGSRHPYSGLWYLPTTDEYLEYGGSRSNCGSFTDGLWAYSPTAGAWTQLAPSTQPNESTNGSIAIPAYDPVTDCIYMDEAIPANFWKYCRNVSTTSWTLLGNLSGVNCASDDMTSAIDPVDRLYLCIGGGYFNTVNLNTLATTDESADSGCPSSLISDNAPGMTWDPVQQRVVLWHGGNSVYLFNPTTHSCTTVTYSGGPPAPSTTSGASGQQMWGTFNRFTYMPGIGGFVVVNDLHQNAYFLRLTDASTAAQQDFTNRCNAAGVIVCDNLSSSANLPLRVCGSDNDSGLYKDCFDPTSVYGTVDNSTYRSGGGSLLFTIPGMAGSDPTGFYRRLFAPSQSSTPAGATVFGQNSTFFVQYSQRMDSPYITNNWKAVGGTTTNWKQQIISSDQSTCGNEEITTVNAWNFGYPQSYSQCGADGFQYFVGSTQYNESNQSLETGKGATGYACAYGTAQPNPACFDYPVGTWVTYYYKVQIGTWSTTTSEIDAWVSTPNSPAYRQWIYMPNHALNQDTGLPGYDVITLIPYWTNRDPSFNAGPTSHTWYQELIVSTNPIAPPQAPPATP
jgi:hypothetical protein